MGKLSQSKQTQTQTWQVEVNRSARIIRTIEEVESVRSIWEEWQVHPTSNINAYLESLRTDSKTITPCVILLSERGVPRTLAIGRVIEADLEFKVGYFPVYRTRGRVLSLLDIGILGSEGDEEARHLINTIMSLLAHGKADMAHVACLPVESQTYALARKLPNPWWRSYFITAEKRWSLHLPGSYQQFFKGLSSKSRSTNSRSQRKLEKTFGNSLRIRCVVNPEEVGAAMNEMDIVAARTYQRGLGTGAL